MENYEIVQNINRLSLTLKPPCGFLWHTAKTLVLPVFRRICC